MKYLVCLFFVLLCNMDIVAQNATKRLKTYISNQGSVYFIRNKKLSECSKQLHKFEFDVTQVEGHDSATINFSILTDNAHDITRLTLSNGETKTECNGVQLLFHDIKGKKYIIRTTAQLCYADMKKLYTSAVPVFFYLTDSQGNQHTATYTSSQWKNEGEEFRKIFFLINQ